MNIINKTIHELFEEHAASSPDTIAVRFQNQELTYGKLNELANRLAHRLISLGIGSGSQVPLCLERSPEVIVGLLGILKAGGAYVPLDPAYPDERLALILRDTAASVLLADRPTAAHLIPLTKHADILGLDPHDELASEPTTNPNRSINQDYAAYVLYTSGSTGNSKGVIAKHRGVVRLVHRGDYCDFSPGEVFLLHSPLTFDASTFEIWGPLLNGARLAIFSPGPPAPDTLGCAIRQYGVTTLWLTAGLFQIMVEQQPECLATVRQVLAGGDVLSPAHVRRALETRGDGILVNGYGPTETTTFACCFRMTRDYRPDGSIPIGQPIRDTTVHVLDKWMQPVGARSNW